MSISSAKMEKDISINVTEPVKDDTTASRTSNQLIYVDPELEKYAFKKFDRYVVPASFVFILLCALDRNNVKNTLDHGSIQS